MDETFAGKVAILGLGYIGLPTAVALATRGVNVVGVDINELTVKAVANGEVPFIEPDLAVGVSGAVSMGMLTASITVPEADAFIIAVPTPFMDDHSADMSFVRNAVELIAPKLRGGEVIVLESTSPPGSTENVSHWLAELRPDLNPAHSSEGVPDLYVAHCPERVLPGKIMIEMITNDRVVGGVTRRCAEKAATIYRVFCLGEILLTDAASAEMSKLVENAYRDVNIAFANELSLISEDLKLDVWEVIRLANHHPRVNVLTPGPGVGGHCIAVDPWFIAGASPEFSPLIRTARAINDSKPHHVAEQLIMKTARFRNPTVVCLGLAYKPNIDDLRESPALQIVKEIADTLPELDLRVAEPFIHVLPPSLSERDNVRLQPAGAAIDDADIVLLLVDHDHFRSLSRSRLEGKVVYDTRGIWR